jgi:hypothetical protein
LAIFFIGYPQGGVDAEEFAFYLIEFFGGYGKNILYIWGTKNHSMLRSMKNLPVKGGAKKPKLSPEAKTEMERKLINMKTRVEDRKKAAEESFEKMGKEKNIGFTSTDVSEEEKRSKYPRMMLKAKQAFKESQERKDSKYGATYDPVKKEYMYSNVQLGDELRDRSTQKMAKSDIEEARNFMAEDAAKLRAAKNKKK